jgi:hypothetical protein
MEAMKGIKHLGNTGVDERKMQKTILYKNVCVGRI